MKFNQILKSVCLSCLFIFLFNACENDDDFNDGPFVSKRTAIVSFSFLGLDPAVNGIINPTDAVITATVPFGTNLTNLVPTITVSPKATVSPASELANNFSNEVIYIITAEDGTTQDWTVRVVAAEEGAQAKLALSDPLWELSPSGTGIPAFFKVDGERGIAFGNNNLYITNNNDKILILNPADGTQTGALSMTGVDSGSPKVSDVNVSADGSILACNTVEWTSAEGGLPTTFKIYRWATDASEPTVFLTYTNTEYRMGDSFSVVGDVTGDAVIMTTFGRKFLEPATRGNIVFKWVVSDGVVASQPQIIEVQGLPSLTRFGSRPHAVQLSVDSEEIFVNANDIDFTKVGLDGSFISRIPNGGRQLYDGFTSYFEIFQFSGKTVMAVAFPRSNIESRLLVIDITNGLENVTPQQVMMSKNFLQGSGEVANINAGGAITINKVSETQVDIYCLITNQALAKFSLTATL